MTNPSADARNGAHTIRVLLADDHALFREGLALLLGQQPGIEIVGMAGGGEEAVRLAGTLGPDVLVVDMQMPDMNGEDVIAAVVKDAPRVRSIVLSAFDADEEVYRAVQAGAAGYCLKTAPPEELADAIRAVAAGAEEQMTAQLSSRLSDYVRHPRLTPRELEVLHLVAAGMSNLEIGGQLGIAEGTVKAHLKNILAKLEARDRSQAVAISRKRGLVRNS